MNTLDTIMRRQSENTIKNQKAIENIVWGKTAEEMIWFLPQLITVVRGREKEEGEFTD